MAEVSLVARSPISPAEPEEEIGGWLVSGRRSSARLTLTDLTPLAKVAVRAAPGGSMAEALATDHGLVSRQRDVVLTSAVPGEWLALAAPGTQASVTAWLDELALRSGQFVSVIDLTHARALVRLTGRQAADVLAKECALDLTDRGCPDQHALRTAVSGLAVDVVRDDRSGTLSYLLHCERSSGQYLFDSLLDAGEELGIDVDGFQPPPPPRLEESR